MPKSLRIAHYFASNAASIGGVQIVVDRLTRTLAARGHQIAVFAADKPKLPFINFHHFGITIPVPLPNGDWSNITLKSPFSKDWDFTHRNFDLLHIHQPYTPFVSWGLITRSKVPVVVSFHGTWGRDSNLRIFDGLIGWFKPHFCRHVKAAIFHSQTIGVKWQSLAAPQVYRKVIYYGVDPVKKSQVKRLLGKTTLIFVARLVERKGLTYLLKALGRLRIDFPQPELIILGEGPLRKYYEDVVKKLKLTGRVHFLGEVIGEAKASFLAQADVFCAPYFDEGYPLSVLEAMAYGLPVVGFQNPAMAEMLKKYPAPQLLVPPADTDQLMLALTKLLTDLKLRQQLAIWVKRESGKYSWQKAAHETEAVYFEVLRRGLPQVF